MNNDQRELSERKKLILKAIIDAHIQNGEPVGSKYLTQNQQLSCSSATIRNEMAELEEYGYLEQPHTSAGRIPSELGYRFYVDWLIDRYNMTQSEISELTAKLRQKQNELDSIMHTAASLAAKLTNYTALAIRPRQARITVQRYELMRLDDYTAVLIMIIGSVVKTKYIRSNRSIPSEATLLLSGVLNRRLTNITAGEITLPLMMEMEVMMGEYDYLVSPVVKAICEIISGFDGGEITFEGINRLLSYPEFYDMDRLREMLALFEKKEALLRVLSEDAPVDDRVQVLIGRENVVKVMDNSTLVFKAIVDNGKTVGAIGIIGPTRMDYRRVIATIDGLSRGIEKAIEEK
ncbi:MAG: heat-inducible transcription repressor HrcA [Clostridia bacterium]|nr:heat-inducible transcription repressor HrcA [Clostridia bacterium]